jgi:hypothetical protein
MMTAQSPCRTQKRTPAGGYAGVQKRQAWMGDRIPPPQSREPRAVNEVPRFMITSTAAMLLPAHPPLCAGSDYLCSLGTNTVLGNSTNGLFGVLPDDGPENWSLNPPGSPPGRPKVVSTRLPV